jgi:hypothetical protein
MSWKSAFLPKHNCFGISTRLISFACRFLWPTYTEDASNHHVLLISLIVSVKYREHLPIWGESLRQLSGLESGVILADESTQAFSLIARTISRAYSIGYYP